MGGIQGLLFPRRQDVVLGRCPPPSVRLVLAAALADGEGHEGGGRDPESDDPGPRGGATTVAEGAALGPDGVEVRAGCRGRAIAVWFSA